MFGGTSRKKKLENGYRLHRQQTRAHRKSKGSPCTTLRTPPFPSVQLPKAMCHIHTLRTTTTILSYAFITVGGRRKNPIGAWKNLETHLVFYTVIIYALAAACIAVRRPILLPQPQSNGAGPWCHLDTELVVAYNVRELLLFIFYATASVAGSCAIAVRTTSELLLPARPGP